jgi:dTDP-4-dehydrorhamnose reductase
LKRITITGAAGLLGAHLVSKLSPSHAVTAIDRNEWWGDKPTQLLKGDLSDSNFLKESVEASQPDVWIHGAGLTDVDGCEKAPDQAHAVHVASVRQLLRYLQPGALLVYISTDSVFSGDSRLWSETDEPRPLNIYAQSKLEGEREAARHPNHVILRTNFYGWSSGRKKTAAEWLHKALAQQESITLFDDFFFTPIYVVDLVERISMIMERRLSGVFHVAGGDRLSKYGFGETMARLMGASMSHVQRGSLANARFAAPRSSDLSLNSDRIASALMLKNPSCDAGLKRFLDHAGSALSCRFQ